ncbi:uncharacterized protein LOC143021887 [Oratosquilla oratoria]|uniref:uncharacterized protein LOC143021887 n=1 Tax=Oratosquilla oratoria TaxID=337810 RepID=UPI003F758689
MAEKWDENTTDSPEVVYDTFTPTGTPAGLMTPNNTNYGPSLVDEGGASTAPNTMTDLINAHMSPAPHMLQQHGSVEIAHPVNISQRTETDYQQCFVCNTTVMDKSYETLKTSMNHSHAPLIVLLMDVLGYKLEDGKLHSQVVCKSCYHLLDIIDELQQTLTESKTDVRTKFLETVHKLKLKYPRTDKMLKPRCLRCIQMTQSSVRKRGKGRGVRGKIEDFSRGRLRGRGRGRGRGRNGDETISDDDCESVAMLEIEPDINVDEESQQQQQQQQQQHQGNFQESYPAQHIQSQGRPVDNTIQKPPQQQQQQQQQQMSSNLVFDTDPAFFSPDEKLKVGVISEEEGPQAFLCMYCKTRCDSALALKMHVRVFHMPVLVYDNGLGTAETRYRMGIKLQNTTPTDFSATEKPFACLFCESSYKLQSSLQSHFREHHSPNKPFQCLECKESFRRPIELSRHRLYRCSVRKQAMFPSTKKER